MLRRHRTRVLALACALAPAALAATEPERDDPRARLEALEELRGKSTPAGDWRILMEARKERDHYGGRRGFRTSQAVQGSVFVNIGPTRADYEFNGLPYFENDSGRGRQVVPHPTDPNIVYLSTAGGGVWKTWDAGAHWEPITDMLGTTAVGALAMDPLNPDVLYLGFGDPFDTHMPGLVRSTDGGATWSDPVQLAATMPGPAVSGVVTDIKVDPGNSAVVLAATDVGLFRSTDAGASFQQVAIVGPVPGDVFYFLWSLASVGPGTWLLTGQLADPTKPPSASNNVTELGIWRSTDDGATWSWHGGSLPDYSLIGRATLAVAASTLGDPATARVFLLAGNKKGDETLDLFRSDDGGLAFLGTGLNSDHTPANPNLGQDNLDILHAQAWYNQALLVDPQDPDRVYVGGDINLASSTDGGNSWTLAANWLPGPLNIPLPYVHADMHAMAMGAGGVLYVASDGGIFVSPDSSSTKAGGGLFTSSFNQGIVSHLFYTVACAPETWPADMQGWVGGGTQDNGTRVRVGSTTTFNQVLGGDGIGLAVSAGTHTDPTLLTGVPDLLIASTEFKLFRSTDGGQSWVNYTNGMGSAQLPFFVRLARDTAAADGQTFVTFTGTPAAVYRAVGGGSWSDISGTLHWQDSNADTTGFKTTDGTSILLRNIVTHPNGAGVYGAVSNKFAYVTADGGAHWLVSVQPSPAGTPAGTGIYSLTDIAFDLADLTGRTYYLTSRAMNLVDANGVTSALPESFGHVYKTTDGGAHFTSLGTQSTGAGGLPFVPAMTINVDPGDNATLYAGTQLGLYRSSDSGANWARMGAGTLPLVQAADVCVSPASRRLVVATYGRGIWQIDTSASGNPAGVRGSGDTNFDGRIDGLDLIDAADAFGTTQVNSQYRWQADLTGDVNAVDGDDLAALLAEFGGQP